MAELTVDQTAAERVNGGQGRFKTGSPALAKAKKRTNPPKGPEKGLHQWPRRWRMTVSAVNSANEANYTAASEALPGNEQRTRKGCLPENTTPTEQPDPRSAHDKDFTPDGPVQHPGADDQHEQEHRTDERHYQRLSGELHRHRNTSMTTTEHLRNGGHVRFDTSAILPPPKISIFLSKRSWRWLKGLQKQGKTRFNIGQSYKNPQQPPRKN